MNPRVKNTTIQYINESNADNNSFLPYARNVIITATGAKQWILPVADNVMINSFFPFLRQSNVRIEAGTVKYNEE